MNENIPSGTVWWAECCKPPSALSHTSPLQLFGIALLAPVVIGLIITGNCMFYPIFSLDIFLIRQFFGTDLLTLFSDLSFDHDEENIFNKLKNHLIKLASPDFLCFLFQFLVFALIFVLIFCILL